MVIKKGYKQTEIGAIPEGWEVKKLRNILSVKYGKSQANIINDSGIFPIIGTGGIVGYSSHFLFDKPSIILGRKGSIDKPQYIDTPFWTIDTAYYTVINENYDSKYLFYKLCCIDWYSCNEASGVPSLNLNTIENIEISIPDYETQKKIATVLSDIDEYILSLEHLIAKKKAIKQGAMQNLLTGKIRLKEFKGEWVEMKLGEIADICTGKKNNENKVQNGKYPFFVRSQQIERINSYAFDGEAIIVPGEGNIGEIFHYINGKFDWHQRVYKISDFDKNCSGKYLYYYVKVFFGKYAIMNTVKATVDSLRLPTFQNFEIKVPPTLAEQTAIATILSDMDAEIEALQAKLNKAKQVKQGAMQQLLTGKIRLVNTSSQLQRLSGNKKIPIAAHIVGGHIVNKLYGSKGWGRTKLQKSMHLVNYCCQLDFGYEYIRNIAGPDSQPLMNHIDSKFKQYGHVHIEIKKDGRKGKHYNYIPTPKITEIEQAYDGYPIEIQKDIDNLLNKIKKMDLARAEIVSTLYAVWNNRIIKGQPINDDLLLIDFYNWSEHKSDFSRDFVLRGLNYMREENIIPIGWGKYIDKK